MLSGLHEDNPVGAGKIIFLILWGCISLKRNNLPVPTDKEDVTKRLLKKGSDCSVPAGRLFTPRRQAVVDRVV